MNDINNDAYRAEFMACVYDELDSDPDNYRANRIIDAYDSAPAADTIDRLTAENAELLQKTQQLDGITLDRLRELVDAEWDGRCKILPCKPGDTVYMRSGCIFSQFAQQGWYTTCEVVNVRYGKRGGAKLYLRPLTENAMSTNYHKIVTTSAIGFTVFLTRAEAEQAKGERE